VIAATADNFIAPGTSLKSPQIHLNVTQDKVTMVAPNQKPARAETRAPRNSPNKKMIADKQSDNQPVPR